MISSLRGSVAAASGSTVVIEVGGVGLKVSVTPQLALSLPIGSNTHLFTTLIVREDDLALFGFTTPDELEIFDLLRGVTGVGPKSALGVLGHLTPTQIASAVATEDDAAFRRVSGIGPKTAKLIVVQLTGKLDVRMQAPTVTAKSTTASDVLIALIGLGWSERDAQAAIDDVVDTADASVTTAVPALLRAALTRLGPQRSGAGR
ncbi:MULTISPECIES: Holliday junction branch migration protein RuvA [unclassified Frondihabitans]|uniref:Holliday junction branch migration protein RuvA n=1 Tax=unclassified Frondihabitans TaxID=2626248 RepID=UPI0006FED8A8|nr:MULTISPECIES: Holliday junction branch migration protein RuvA [unclassified Frondihabitans]KQQ27527.1 ATP-dependent DNA helicase RuvA [Frondihabitans sp. Leaf304]RPE75127.1 Holliday junction DNA helicase subunit RuvA [Frondihabitans sp. PhB153]RPF04369.1 Holliday junction DNA helicase subunit RuvA [Frondihabitans sp. PhB161]